MAQEIQVLLSPKKTAAVLITVTALLVALHLLAGLFDHYLGHDSLPFTEQFVRLFDIDSEMNVPAWYSSSLLLTAAILLTLIFFTRLRQGGPFRLHWGLLALLFFALSLDEQAAMHECLILPMQSLFDTSGLLFLAWVIPGGLFVLVFGAVFCTFTFALPSKTRLQFILSGLLYVGGALGLELFGGRHMEQFGKDNMAYELLCAVEESLEMAGIVLFIYALMGLLCEVAPSYERSATGDPA